MYLLARQEQLGDLHDGNGKCGVVQPVRFHYGVGGLRRGSWQYLAFPVRHR